MDENRLFKIGEVAKMYHVSMGTLRLVKSYIKLYNQHKVI